MTHVSVAPMSGRTAQRVLPASEGLRPAHGILLGLGLSSLIWTALIALVAF